MTKDTTEQYAALKAAGRMTGAEATRFAMEASAQARFVHTPEQMRALAAQNDAQIAKRLPRTREHRIAKHNAAALRAAADEVDRLRAVIANAPHESHCSIHPAFGYTPNCTCWKAKSP